MLWSFWKLSCMKNDKEINFGHVNGTTRRIRQTLLLGRDRFLISSNLTIQKRRFARMSLVHTTKKRESWWFINNINIYFFCFIAWWNELIWNGLKYDRLKDNAIFCPIDEFFCKFILFCGSMSSFIEIWCVDIWQILNLDKLIWRTTRISNELGLNVNTDMILEWHRVSPQLTTNNKWKFRSCLKWSQIPWRHRFHIRVNLKTFSECKQEFLDGGKMRG